MRSLIFEGNTWGTYEKLRKSDPLKHNLSGLWSRRLSQKDRVVYKFDDQYVYIFPIGGHYDQF